MLLLLNIMTNWNTVKFSDGNNWMILIIEIMVPTRHIY
jgi:hypothetical protein